MLARVFGEISAAMPHQNLITYIDAGRRARSMRMHPSLPMTVSSVNRLLLHADCRFMDRIPNATQSQSKRIDELTPGERSAKKGVLCTAAMHRGVVRKGDHGKRQMPVA
eukprot:6214460-Pleurochrysis_carterae.AAC.2